MYVCKYVMAKTSQGFLYDCFYVYIFLDESGNHCCNLDNIFDVWFRDNSDGGDHPNWYNRCSNNINNVSWKYKCN